MHFPRSLGLTDSIMEELASHLPNIVTLNLFMENETGSFLTEAAVISLARQCPRLDRCELRGRLNGHVMIEAAKLGILKSLSDLEVQLKRFRADSKRFQLSAFDAQQLREFMPRLHYLNKYWVKTWLHGNNIRTSRW